MEFTPRPRTLPACDACYVKKTRCDRQDPCGNCRTAHVDCMRLRPRLTSAQSRTSDQLEYMLKRMVQLEQALGAQTKAKEAEIVAPAESIAVAEVQAEATLPAPGRHDDDDDHGNNDYEHDEHDEHEHEQDRNDYHIANADGKNHDNDDNTGDGHDDLRDGPHDVVDDTHEHRDDLHTNNNPVPSRKRKASPVVDTQTSRAQPMPTKLPSPLLDRGELPPPSPLLDSHSPQNQQLASLDLRRYLRLEKPVWRDIDVARQEVLEAAVAAARRVMADPGTERVQHSRPNLYETSMYPPIEFMHVLLRETAASPVKGYFFRVFAGASLRLLEHMALQLARNSVHEQRRVQYLVCVNLAAFVFLTAAEPDDESGEGETETSAEMAAALADARLHYRDNALRAVDVLDTTVWPDVTQLHALHAASMLMQEVGNMRSAWKLNTAACRIGHLLRGRTAAQLGLVDDDAVAALRIACMRIYIFDTSLSANNYQPACLAPMDMDRSVLRPSAADRPGDGMLSVLLSIAQVQEVVIRTTRACVDPRQAARAAGTSPSQAHALLDHARLAALQPRMQSIRRDMAALRARPPACSDAFLQFEWLSVDLVFHSLMTTIVRLGIPPGRADARARSACLENARKCLFAFKSLLEILGCARRPHRYLSSLAWIAPLFPLRPMYMVFTNVVVTSDALDLKILQDLARELAGAAALYHSVMEIQRLCVTFVDLYADYAERIIYSPEYQYPRIEGSPVGEGAETAPETDVVTDESVDGSASVPPVVSLDPLDSLYDPLDPAFGQQMDWELFCAHPSVFV